MERSKARSKTTPSSHWAARLKLNHGKEFADKLGSEVKIDQESKSRKDQDKSLQSLLDHFGLVGDEHDLDSVATGKSAALAFAMTAFTVAPAEAPESKDKALALSAKLAMNLKNHVRFNKGSDQVSDEAGVSVEPEKPMVRISSLSARREKAPLSVSTASTAAPPADGPPSDAIPSELEMLLRSEKRKPTLTELQEAKAPEPLQLQDLSVSPRRRRDPEAQNHFDYFESRKVRGAEDLNANSSEYRGAMKRRVAMGRSKFDSNPSSMTTAGPPSLAGDLLAPKTPRKGTSTTSPEPSSPKLPSVASPSMAASTAPAWQDSDLRSPQTSRNRGASSARSQASESHRLPEIRSQERTRSPQKRQTAAACSRM